jgi:predicted nucleic acid-binding protein
VSLVLDASLSLSWYFEDERTAGGDRVLDRVAGDGALVPSLWRLEVANGFQMAIRRKRIDAAFRDRAIGHLLSLPIEIDPDTDAYAWTSTLRLADRFGLTLYDAAYLELAQRRGAPLASLDKKLRDAGRSLGVSALGS